MGRRQRLLSADKVPCTKGYAKTGLRGSAQLAIKFAEDDTFGYCTGPRSRVTVLDIDIADDSHVEQAQRRFGPAGIVVQTASGKFHLLYRHAGEPRAIKPFEGLPWDVLGGKGYAVAAGSVTPRGCYRIVAGKLADLSRLRPANGLLTALGATPGKGRPSMDAPAKVKEGERNNALFNYCRSVVGRCTGLDDLLDRARTWAAQELETPMPEDEIARTVASIWRFRDGRKRIMQNIIEAPQYKALTANPMGLALFAYLSAENGPDAEFWISDGLATSLGWPRRSIPSARRTLVNLGLVECVQPPRVGSPARYRWRLHP